MSQLDEEESEEQRRRKRQERLAKLQAAKRQNISSPAIGLNANVVAEPSAQQPAHVIPPELKSAPSAVSTGFRAELAAMEEHSTRGKVGHL